jgi:hypothetical protein
MMAKTRSKAEQTRLVVLLSILAVVAVVWIVMVLRGGDLSGGAAVRGNVDYQPHNLPRLDMAQLEGGHADQSGGQRNPFTFGAPPTPSPRPPTPTRPQVVRTPRPTPTPRMALGADGEIKPPPPPFDREYLGHFGPLRLQVAAFRKPGPDPETSEIEVAPAGTVLDEIFIIREIGLESVVVGFVGYDRSEDTRVPVAEK